MNKEKVKKALLALGYRVYQNTPNARWEAKLPDGTVYAYTPAHECGWDRLINYFIQENRELVECLGWTPPNLSARFDHLRAMGDTIARITGAVGQSKDAVTRTKYNEILLEHMEQISVLQGDIPNLRRPIVTQELKLPIISEELELPGVQEGEEQS